MAKLIDDTETEDTEKYVTAESLDAKLNAALTNYNKRFEKKFQEVLAPFAARFDELAAKLDAKPPASETKTDADSDKASPEIEAKFQRMSDALAAEIKKREATEAKAADDAAKAKSEKLSSTLATAIRDVGIANPTFAKAAQLLLESTGRVVYDEDGAVKIKVTDKYGENLIDLATGLGDWAKSDEGSSFMPARPANGSGGSPSKANGKIPSDPKAAKLQAARDLLSNMD